jgi:outer membrane biogenesis lipoprotein LolB
MVKNIRTWKVIILSLCIVLEIGCATLRPKEKTDDFLYRAGDLIEKRCAYWQRFEAQFSLKFNAPYDSNRYLLSYYQDHDRLRIDLISLWGNTIAVLVIKPQMVILWLPARKTVYITSNANNLLSRLAGIEGHVTDILPMVTGCISSQMGQSVKILSTKSEGLDLVSLKLKQNDRIWEIDYSPPLSLAVVENLPKTIRIHSSDSDINLELQKATKQDVMSSSKFEISYPHGTSVIEL